MVVAIAALVTASSAEGAGRWLRKNAEGQSPEARVSVGDQPWRPAYEQRRYEANRSNPKYYWGLHERHLQSIGVPNGDIGIRGNGITATPW